jgi:hypothetical protein
LSIVKSLLAAHGGSIALEPSKAGAYDEDSLKLKSHQSEIMIDTYLNLLARPQAATKLSNVG